MREQSQAEGSVAGRRDTPAGARLPR